MKDRKIRLLLVEDDKVDQMAFERFVRSKELPYDYTIAGSVAEADKIIKSISFDVIIVDYMLGDGTSFELFDLFKELPVIVTTGTGNEEVAVEAMKLGACDYLIKDPEDNYLKTLPSTVELALKRKQTEKELQNYHDRLESMVKERTAQLEAEIVERKQAEDALKLERNNLRNIFEAIEDGIYIVNQQHDIQYVNPVLVKDFGYYEGRKCYEYFHDRDEVCPWCKNHDVLAGKTVRWEWCSFKNERTYDLIDTPMTLPDGSIGKLEIFRDITEQKKLEAQFRQSQKMEAIGILAGGIAHDFNNLLTVIIGNAQLALMDVIKDESLRKEIEEIKKAGDRAASLTRQLLAFSRKQIVRPEILDINELLTDIEKMLGRLIGEDIELLTIPDPELWQVEIDPSQIEQVIMNLAVNARDAMPQGGKLTIETANVELNDTYFRDRGVESIPGHYVVLTVSDTGSGMDKETREHIFEPFFTTKEVGKGTGLGLSTVYGIAKQNNGFVWVYSEPEQGTTFKVYLPEAKKDAGPEEKEQSPVDDLGGSETVLIVEDDDVLRKLAQRVLHSYGYRVLDAENGEDALRVSKAHEGQIDLMITDVVMPKIGGREAAERLQPLYPQMKVIYMSGYTDNTIVHHGILAPELNFIQKPFTPEGLAHKMRKVLDDENEK
jgi:two-component system, cell cycle sensor histidine kinase and response regulator CckA